MPRISRVVVPGVAHHVTQRGNRRQTTFFREEDYALYLSLLNEQCRKFKLAIWSYCLMPNHVHLVAVPPESDSLRAVLSEAHRRYTWLINRREKWRGCLWQGRFFSFPLDQPHLLSAVRYVELNPVRAHLVSNPHEYKWSSAPSRLRGYRDPLLCPSPLEDTVGDWERFLLTELPLEARMEIRDHERTGRPLGDEIFVAGLEQMLNRKLMPGKRGRPARG